PEPITPLSPGRDDSGTTAVPWPSQTRTVAVEFEPLEPVAVAVIVLSGVLTVTPAAVKAPSGATVAVMPSTSTVAEGAWTMPVTVICAVPTVLSGAGVAITSWTRARTSPSSNVAVVVRMMTVPLPLGYQVRCTTGHWSTGISGSP